MAISYIVILPFAFSDKYGAHCTYDNIYPNVMGFLPLAYIIMVIFAFWLKKNANIDWQAAEKIPLSNDNAIDYTNKDLFEAQTKTFLNT